VEKLSEHRAHRSLRSKVGFKFELRFAYTLPQVFKAEYLNIETALTVKNSVFWDITLLKVSRRFGEHVASIFSVEELTKRESKPTVFTLISCLVYSLTPKKEATCSSETSVGFERAAQRYVSADGDLHNHRYENLKS
jgi:hypothetical protein